MTFKTILFGLTALISSSSFASTTISVKNFNFNPEEVTTGVWGGEPIVGDVRRYGIAAMHTVAAFFEEQELRDVVSSILHFETDEDLHAVHLHGIGSGTNISEVHGYSIIVGNEQAGSFQLKTYKRTAGGFTLDEEFSTRVRGVLDYGSAAKLAILHGPTLESLVTLTLGKTEYEYLPEAEEKFANHLTNVTALLARDRGSLEYMAPFYDGGAIGIGDEDSLFYSY